MYETLVNIESVMHPITPQAFDFDLEKRKAIKRLHKWEKENYAATGYRNTPIVNWIRRDVFRDGNTPIVIFCGRQRSGKTAFAMYVAFCIHPEKFEFCMVVDTIEAFAEAMNKYTNTVIILDEATASLFVYDWHSFMHKVFSIIQDSQAYRHNIVFIVLPQVKKLGKLHIDDADAIIEMRKKRGFNPDTGKWEKQFFYKYLIQHKQYSELKRRDPIVQQIRTLCGPVPLPPSHIWKPYIDTAQAEYKQKILSDQLALIMNKSGLTSNAPKIVTGPLVIPA
jgi:hypothetical protein